jgi:hypothetical protein
MPSFKVGDKFICRGWGIKEVHVCKITYIGSKNEVEMEWILGDGSEVGWDVHEVQCRIIDCQWVKYSPVIMEFYET